MFPLCGVSRSHARAGAQVLCIRACIKYSRILSVCKRVIRCRQLSLSVNVVCCVYLTVAAAIRKLDGCGGLGAQHGVYVECVRY